MIRGTTAQFRFQKIPYAKAELIWATIKFWQNGNSGTVVAPLPITKRLEHCDAPEGSNELCVSLTAEETSRFSDERKAYVQLRAQAQDGTIFGTKSQLITVYPMRDDILEENPTMPLPDKNGVIIFDGGTIVN